MTSPSHAAPWTITRYIADLFSPPTSLARNARPALLTGREAAARALFGESVNWDPAEMNDFDESPILQGGWLAVVDRRVAALRGPQP